MADATLDALGIKDHPDDIAEPSSDSGGKATPKEFGDVLSTLGIKEHPDDEPATSKSGLRRVYIRPHSMDEGDKSISEPIKKGVGYAEQIAQGIPILSPLADHFVAAAKALSETIKPSSGDQSYGSSFGERYDNALDQVRNVSKDFAEKNPVGSTIANAAGGIASAIPLAMTGPGAVAMGLRGPSMALRALAGGVGQGTIGASDAALRGDNPLVGGGIGAAGGIAGPVIGEAAGAGGNALANYVWPRQGPLKTVDPININRLMSAISGESDQTLDAASQRVGPHGFIGDLNQGLTDLTGAAAVTPGTGKAMVRSAYQTRADAQGPRIESALTQALGPKLDQVQLANMTTQARKAAADPLYDQWRTMQVHPTPEIKALIPRLQAAKAFGMAKELAGIAGEPINQNFFTGGPQKAFPTTQSWDYIKQALDRRISQAYNKEGGGPLARKLVELKHDMIDEIRKTPAGKVWDQARSVFADHSALLDQQAAGRDTFLGGRSGTTVDELRHEIQTLSVPEMVARRQGLRAAAQEALGQTETGDTRLRTLMLAPNNQEKIRLMMGNPAEADRLINALKSEKHLSEKAMDVLGNNATGASNVGRAERKNMLMPEPAREWGIDFQKPGTWIPPSVRDQFSLSGMINAQRGAAHSAANEQLARILTLPNNSQSINLLRALRNEGARQSQNYQTAKGVGDVLAGGIAGPGTSSARRQVPAQTGPIPDKRASMTNGVVMSDATPDPIRAGAQYAQSSPFQMRPIGGGLVQVINIRTGQVIYTGSASGAANAQASSAGQARRIID